MHLFIRRIVNVSLSFLFILDVKADVISGNLANKILDLEQQKELYVQEVTVAFTKEAEEEFDIHAYGFGGSVNPNVNKIGVKFDCDKQVGIKEARWLLVTLQRKFVDIINKHEGLRSFLVEYPFPLIRADVDLSFKENSDQKIDNVEYMYIARNKVFYCKLVDQKNYKYGDLLIEPYEETLKAYKFEDKPKIFKKII